MIQGGFSFSLSPSHSHSHLTFIAWKICGSRVAHWAKISKIRNVMFMNSFHFAGDEKRDGNVGGVQKLGHVLNLIPFVSL